MSAHTVERRECPAWQRRCYRCYQHIALGVTLALLVFGGWLWVAGQ